MYEEPIKNYSNDFGRQNLQNFCITVHYTK